MNQKIKMKITVIGDPGSGKSSFINNLVGREFTDKYQSTENYEVTIYEFKNNHIEYQIHLWECGANHLKQNKFLRKAFFRNSSATFMIFDLCSPQWKTKIVKWIEEAYNFESFLVYAIGTKMDIFEQKTAKEKHDLIENKQSLFSENNLQEIQGEYEFENNLFFDEYQIRHYYQSAKQKVPYEIRNIFITINDDKQKLTRSSLARGTKFDNSILENYIKASHLKEKSLSPENRFNHKSSIFQGSVKIEEFEEV